MQSPLQVLNRRMYRRLRMGTSPHWHGNAKLRVRSSVQTCSNSSSALFELGLADCVSLHRHSPNLGGNSGPSRMRQRQQFNPDGSDRSD
eukprot:5288323-Amphidinium_carterae.1